MLLRRSICPGRLAIYSPNMRTFAPQRGLYPEQKAATPQDTAGALPE